MKTGCLPAGFDQFSEKILKEVFAPTVVGVPPEDASRGLVRLPNGEIRHYGEYFSRGRWEKCYVESLDCGLNWRMRPAQEESVGAAFLSPASGHWLLLDSNGFAHHYLGRHLVHRMPKLGTYLFRSTAGIDGPFTCEHISEREYQILRPPLHLLSRHRWLLPTQYRRKEDGHMVAVALLSDDDWATCREVDLPTAPRHQVKPPHKGLRWQNDACEPSVVELPGGRLWCLLRTSQDFFYETYSEDGGNTWSEGRPSRFSNTITMPTLLSLSHGRLMLFWCNTAPLPEPDHRVFFGLKENGNHLGLGEDAFTNRDAFHAAVSKDGGTTWTGFQEVLLNDHRNDSDFRSIGGLDATLDRSVHQSQALELPFGKVLVSIGQHPAMRRFVIFDPAWLEEKTRKEDFITGLGNWSTQQFVKSILGHSEYGHCAYNRRPGAQLIPDPANTLNTDGGGILREVLQIARHPDPRLVYEREGAAWNFPAGHAGCICLTIRLPYGSQGANICLCDHWFNPVDPSVTMSAQFVLNIDGGANINKLLTLSYDKWFPLEIEWTDSRTKGGKFRLDSGPWFELPLCNPSVNGISYLHIQSAADGADPFGILLRDVKANVQ